MDQNSQLQPKKPWIAALLAFVMVGLGHLYAGKLTKCIALFAGMWMLFFIMAISPMATSFTGLAVLIISMLLIWIYSIVNAAWLVKRTPFIERKAYDRWYVYIGVWIVFALFMEFSYPSLRDTFAHVHFAENTTSAMAPGMQAGDRFAWSNSESLERNDIAVFSYLGEDNMIYVARCVATPEDEFEIKQGLVYINNKLADNPQQIKFNYVIKNEGNFDFESLNIDKSAINPLSGQYFMIELTSGELKTLEDLAHNVNIRRMGGENNPVAEDVFPYTESLDWNLDNYGPITIPKKGERVEINAYNAPFYGVIISNSEDVHVDINEEGLLEQDGALLTSYVFTEDYYFMIGDNRHNSYDSRFKGVVPANLVYGKANYIFWSSKRSNIGKRL